MQLHEELHKSEAVFCLCSNDLRVAERASELLLAGYGNVLIFSGGVGALTQEVFSEPEADVFAKIAIEKGVPQEKLIIENKSTNNGENVRFTYNLLQEKGLKLGSFILVQKPFMERRTYATFKKQWPDAETTITVTSPKMTFDEYVSGIISKEHVIHTMVGDLQRIREYAKKGFQIEQDIPDVVWDSYEKLVKLGYTEHLIPH